VIDVSGGAWFPDGVRAKRDVHDRPFLHGHDVILAVPAESLHVVCARGLEFARTGLGVHPAVADTHLVECDPPRLFDPAAEGWYGADLHIHMNYSGDLICSPADAARMQRGESPSSGQPRGGEPRRVADLGPRDARAVHRRRRRPAVVG
jgi:hypothetical protein